MPEIIGLSVSFCILDIANGKVKAEEVTKIIGSTACLNNLDWGQVISKYALGEWKHADVQLCAKTLWQMLADGKIEQPRLTDPDFDTWERVIRGPWLVDGVQKWEPK